MIKTGKDGIFGYDPIFNRRGLIEVLLKIDLGGEKCD